MTRGSAKKRALSAPLAVGIVALGALVYFAPSFYEVVDKGPFVRFYAPEPGSVYELRLFDTITVYGDQESRPSTDEVSAAALVALAGFGLLMALHLGELLRASATGHD
ncbi:MAG: hypothetical protein FVQ78_03140 [Solirubrobacterales bacterium]|nr:hypothetical protein [Solirubrobacterales bacterium]